MPNITTNRTILKNHNMDSKMLLALDDMLRILVVSDKKTPFSFHYVKNMNPVVELCFSNLIRNLREDCIKYYNAVNAKEKK